MTVFEWLFKAPAALHRQTTAPLYNERLAFLTHMKERDRKYNTLRAMATHLLHINRTIGFSNGMRLLTMEELRSAGRAWAQYNGPLLRTQQRALDSAKREMKKQLLVGATIRVRS